MIRVFARKTSYTPTDDMAFYGPPPFNPPAAKSVRVNCVFTWDKRRAEWLANQWSLYYSDVKIGGPAFNDCGGEFTPGQYLKQGEVITSRGCPNKCAYCYVPEREGQLRLLDITDGYDILDNNLLACPREHITKVFNMLKKQAHKAMFRGGLEAKRIDDWFIEQLAQLRVQCMFLAYDRPSDKEILAEVIPKLKKAGYSNRQICCYVLLGYKNDCPSDAIKRLQYVQRLGAMPFAMYFRGDASVRDVPPADWQKIVRPYCRPKAIFSTKNQSPVIRPCGG